MRPCSICQRADLDTLHAAIQATSIRQAAARFGLSVATLARHYAAHRETPAETCETPETLASSVQPQATRLPALLSATGHAMQQRSHEPGKRSMFLPGNTIGHRFTALPPLVVEQQKNDFLRLAAAGKTIRDALMGSGMSAGSLYLWAQTDERLHDALEHADTRRRIELEHLIDDVISNPAGYDQALTRPSWANLIMFRTKKLEPAYRDSAKLEVNVGIGATMPSDWQAAVRAAREQDVAVIEHPRTSEA